MVSEHVLSTGRHRRRRRRQDKPPVSAHLLPDERLDGEAGLLSEDLFAELFPSRSNGIDTADDDLTQRPLYVAVTPWVPASMTSVDTIPWTILPVKKDESQTSKRQLAHSSLLFPAHTPALQSFERALENVSPHKTHKSDAPIEIRILDVVPLALETVFINLDIESLQAHEEAYQKFGGGFGAPKSIGNKYSHALGRDSPTRGKRKKSTIISKDQQKRWRSAVQKSLDTPKIVHTGDLLSLPLPSHPITQASAPPLKIMACEPVSQGIILPSTRIVMVHSNDHLKNIRLAPQSTHPASAGNLAEIEESAEDTSNEQFFSAVEDRADSQSATPTDEDEMSDTLDSQHSETENSELSDSEDMISLNAPGLPPIASGVMSSVTAATPRALGGLTNGVATPGSVHSSFTATTMRAGPGSKSRVFQAHGMLDRLPDELLHPRPGSEDDEEARVYVDVSTLVKIGCFSGDWVKIEATSEAHMSGLGLWGLGNAGAEDEPHDWRSVKVFGIPESIAGKTPRYTVKSSHERRSSISYLLPAPITSHAYMSPVLLANLGNPTHLRISALYDSATSRKVPTSLSPPAAKEITLLKLATPLATDRQLQPSLFAGLKSHFESRQRIVKEGDLIGISVDEALGRATFETSNAEEDFASADLLAKPGLGGDEDPKDKFNAHNFAVAWFKVGSVNFGDTDNIEDIVQDIWGGVAAMDPLNTRMSQAGSEQGNVPPATNSTWQYYLGTKRRPATPAFSEARVPALAERPKPYIGATRRRLRELIGVATQSRAVSLGLPPMAILLTSNQRNIGKATLTAQACEDLGIHTFTIDAYDILSEGAAGGGDVKTEGLLKARAERALSCGSQFTAILLRHVDALNADRMITALREILADSRILVATSCEVDKISDGIRALFTHELEINAPDEAEREDILQDVVTAKGIRLAPDVELSSVAVKTAALVAGDLVDVVERAIIAQKARLEALISTSHSASDPPTMRDVLVSGGLSTNSLTPADFTTAVDAARKTFADAIGAPKIPSVSWADVGGLSHVISSILETIQLPLTHPALFSRGLKKRSGILFYGPPGTGKTLLAKAIATEFSLNFFSVKGPELLNMYIGESEANVRRVFQRARDARPCVVFFDELDSVAPKRGNQGDSGGVMDRIVSQLLAELDGMSGGSGDDSSGNGGSAAGGGQGVFVIGATNRPDLLDQALLRPGRFDKMLYLGVADTHAKQEKILEALTRKFTLNPSLSLSRIAETLPFTFTGADLYALCSDAMLKAITRQARAVDAKIDTLNADPDHLKDALINAAEQKGQPSHSIRGPPGKVTTAWFFDHLATKEDTDVVVTEPDFNAAQKELVPSVSVEELRHYERVRKTFEGQSAKEKEVNSKGQQHPNGELKGSGNATQPSVLPTQHHSQKAVMRRKARDTGAKGKGKGKAAANEFDDNDADEEIVDGGLGDRESGSDDEFVIRADSDGLAGKGKGRVGVGSINSGGFGNATEGDEDLYS
ncbi:AAA-domain-containing protein [Viridothelium virens]|uniref:Peroxisomal ATPase PEX6 n=1 Tax=Viridothelium virens TaxID=1048519 RepID=A0A6A6HIW6_VIRVR|nr:AAA-domain-containing protein [Viridothelium virens]